MKGKTEKILCGFSSIFPKYLGKYARKMRARRYETGSEGKFASRWRAKSPDALCAVLPLLFLLVLSGHCSPACALLPHLRTHNNHSTFPYDVCHTMNSSFLSFSFPQKKRTQHRPRRNRIRQFSVKAIPHKDCATDASSNFSSDETKSGVNT